MHRHAAAVALLITLGCAERPQPTSPVMLTVYGDAAARSDNANGGNFGTQLAPENEFMPAGVANTSSAVGNAIFHLSADGKSLAYKLIVANIENAFMAHIHRGLPGTNGPIAVWLFPSTAVAPGPLGIGRSQGVIAEGTITAENFIGPLAGQDMAALLALIENGEAYVNVHTNDNVAPINTGPGDYPGGEIRGAISHRGH